MAAQTAATDDSGLRPLFEMPLPENPTLLEALSDRNARPNKKPVDPASFTEIFGELHFQEKQPSQEAPPVSSWPDAAAEAKKGEDESSLQEPKPASTVQATGDSSASSSLVLGTDSESTVDADDDMLKVEKRPLTSTFPPPIRSIGPRVCFRSFREDGRLVVKEVVTPGKELLQASREGGRLRLQFASASTAAAGVVGVDEEEETHEDEDSHERAK
ncbi:unnamed protein product [Urochloa decumbens]|uniref:FAF domain-containing protein n=1 Tax=Urochloa decumbens TaxID=240449 RepID=A0ABC8WLT9_9POAL